MSESSVLVETIEDTNPELLTKADVLDGVFTNYFDDPRFRNFVAYHDLALPLAHLISHSYITQEPEEAGVILIDEAYTALLKLFGVEQKPYFEITDILSEAGEALTVMVPEPNPEDEVEDERL